MSVLTGLSSRSSHPIPQHETQQTCCLNSWGRKADIEKALLSRLFGHAMKLGACRLNATKDVEPHGGQARTKAVDPAVLARFLAWLEQQTPQRRIIGMAAEYCSLAGSRKVEFLDLSWPQINETAKVVRGQSSAASCAAKSSRPSPSRRDCRRS